MADSILLCPYCMSQVDNLSGNCPFCHEDMTRDAGFEMTPQEYAREKTKECNHCGRQMMALAVLCPHCRKQENVQAGI